MKSDHNEQAGSKNEASPKFSADRRRFIQAAAILGAGACLADPKVMRAAIIAARKSGKIVLTEASLNAFIESMFAKPPAARNAMLAQARANFPAFINTYFTLTTAQEQSINALSTGANLTTLQQVIDQSRASNKPVRVALTQVVSSGHSPRMAKGGLTATGDVKISVDKGGNFTGAELGVSVTC